MEAHEIRGVPCKGLARADDQGQTTMQGQTTKG